MLAIGEIGWLYPPLRDLCTVPVNNRVRTALNTGAAILVAPTSNSIMRKIIPVLFAVSALAAAGSTFAADPGNHAGTPTANSRAQWKQHAFDRIDTNHDGLISRAEYQAWIDSRFARLDTGGTGSVTAADIAASPATSARVQKRAEAFVKRYDTSGTGSVTKAEFETKEMSRFDKLSGGADTLTEAQLTARRHGGRHGHRQDPDAASGTDGG